VTCIRCCWQNSAKPNRTARTWRRVQHFANISAVPTASSQQSIYADLQKYTLILPIIILCHEMLCSGSIGLYNLFLNNYIRQFILPYTIAKNCRYRYIITNILEDFDKYVPIKIFNSFILLRPWFGRTCVW
jgi:hypothetical protein